MKSFFLYILLMFFSAQDSADYSLTVTVSGLNPLKGDLYISLHNRPEYFQFADSAFMKKKIIVDKETETIVFKGVPAGEYAIALYHDENLNGVMETNGKGIPREGYGFSNKSKFLGKPKFQHAAFDLSGDDTIEVKMVYLSGSKHN